VKNIKSEKPIAKASFRKLLQQIHRDEGGAVTIETILIIAAIAVPLLIFLLKFGLPKIREFFMKGLDDLENEAGNAADGV